ncbi:MAG TPA: adenosylhomocysteinase [Clostridiales bacterium UBA8153]|nr:adenosylhomocysteinase [Clostridiales bacterium UBA8153]
MSPSDQVDRGRQRILWAHRRMPVVQAIARRWEVDRPLQGVAIGACLHVTTETAVLALALQAGGARVALCASNPLSTQDEVAAALRDEYGIATFARRGDSGQQYYDNIRSVLATLPDLIMDDGADVIGLLHSQKSAGLSRILAATEETTTGVNRLRAMQDQGKLAFPVIAVNDAHTKHLFDNRYGTGQSTMDAIVRATNVLVAGTTVVVAGYGWCGRGVAARARGMGARVCVVEVDPIRALEAAMDGFQVMDMAGAAPHGDIFITVTGNTGVIRREHFPAMKDSAILCNSGHFNVEIDLVELKELAVSVRPVREHVEEYRLPSGKSLFVLAQGRLVNLAAAEGHPAEVMDMSFANQALVVEWLARERPQLAPAVVRVPESIDRAVARLKLEAMGIPLEPLTEKQRAYMRSWQEGTTA